MDARWTRKHGQRYFGYKDHVSVDVKHKLIRAYEITDAAEYDEHQTPRLLSDNSSRDVYGDGHYAGAANLEHVQAESFREKIHRTARRNRPLTQQQRISNTCKSTVRARVEHVFARLRQIWPKKFMRVVGLARARMKIGLLNLTYNFDRFAYLTAR